MKRMIGVLLLTGVLLSSGCAYMNVRRPLGTDFNKTELGAKEGRSTARSALWLFAWGDAGTRAAANQGGIKVIYHADDEYFMLLWGLYASRTTVLYGD